MKFISAIILLTCTFIPLNIEAAWKVWTSNDTIRPLRHTGAGPLKKVVLAAARNEYGSFQILVRTDEPVRIINIMAGDFRGPRGKRIRSSQARLYREHQLKVTASSNGNPNSETGWYSDALIPLDNGRERQNITGNEFVAIPFDLPPHQTQGFFVEIHVPKDATPGIYRGKFEVIFSEKPTVVIAVILTVWNFSLPDIPTLQTVTGSPVENLRRYYLTKVGKHGEKNPPDWTAIETQCAEELSRHRVNAVPPLETVTPLLQSDSSWQIPPEQAAKLRSFIDTYHLNAVRTPHPGTIIRDIDKEQEKLRAWLSAFDRLAREVNRPHVLFYTYLKDEPNSENDYRLVRKWGRAIRKAQSVVKVLVVEQTKTQDEKWGTLGGAVDIWCPAFFLHDEQSASERRLLGEIIWCYTALNLGRPTPWWLLDAPLLNYRITPWIAWRYNMKGILYWGAMSHWQEVEDPWTDSATYKPAGNKGPKYNGEGVLLYPADHLGYEGVVPSLRLKALRDGIQDYEYLAILDRAGLGDKARRLILPLAESWFNWEKDPAVVKAIRLKLAQMITEEKKRKEVH
jgi:hypothetical protein